MATQDQRLTPMLAQYRQIKARFPDALVLFRLGDFYETFEADAKTASRELELVLTNRTFAKGVRLPMAGVPHHHVQSYVARLIEKGYKVALVEQLEDPRKVKRLVKRDVIRVITPGTVVEDALLRPKSDNYLAAIARREPRNPEFRSPLSTSSTAFGLAFLDLSTGEFATTQIDGGGAEARLLDEIQRVQPNEYVLPQSLAADAEFVARLKAVRPARISPIDDRAAETGRAREALLAQLGTATLEPAGCEELPLAVSAAGAALAYLESNRPNGESNLAHLRRLWTYSLADYMTLDAATRRNLELVAPLAFDINLKNVAQRSLFGVLDQTVTAMGARLLKRWIQQPLLDLASIQARLDAVQELAGDAFMREDLRRLLDGLYDVERLAGRIGFGSANARDLIACKRALLRLPGIKARLKSSRARPNTPPPIPDREQTASETPGLLLSLEEQLDELGDVAGLIERAIVDDPPILTREGGIIKPGYEPLLDELRDGATRGKKWLDELEERERRRTGIKNLRVRYNEVFGFFIELPRSQAHLAPAEYERRATISHAERFVTDELRSHEANILATQERVKDLEYDLFVEVRREVARHLARLQTAARVLAQLDVLCALAEAAARYGYVRPIVDDGEVVEIYEGRHPVVERYLPEGETFVPNDTRLDSTSQRLIILTGPNMSGKSVYIRQVALIVLMAQIGSFVPARSARLGLVDRIFTRVGASDDIAQGRSTFLVEMSETANILGHATPRSLIVLDEVGRGTSTYDGISLAWAIAEELYNVVGARTLFATHYHELTRLEMAEAVLANGSAVKNFTMAVHEQNGEVVFLRQVTPGGAEKSFGIHVARLAGLPGRVVERAEEVLRRLEEERGGDGETGKQGANSKFVIHDSRFREKGDRSREEGEGEPGGEHPRPAASEKGEARDVEIGLSKSERREEAVQVRSEGRDAEGGGASALIREENTLYAARAEAWRGVLREIAGADIANLTPLEALNLLNDLQVRIRAADTTGSR